MNNTVDLMEKIEKAYPKFSKGQKKIANYIMKNYEIKGNVIEITLDNDKVVKVGKVYIERCIEKLDIDMEDALLTWLEDEGYMENLDQEELCDLAKENKSHKVVNAKVEKEPTKKTQKERVAKSNPDKEYIVGVVAEFLEDIVGKDNVNIENKAKLITFTYNGNEYKLDLVQKRPPKAGK